MPVEIKEMVVKTVVDKGQEDCEDKKSKGAVSAQDLAAIKEQIIEECMMQVADLLVEMKER